MKERIPKALKRRRFSRRGAIKVSLAGASACFADAFLIEPNRLTIRREEIFMPCLPKTLDGLRVGAMADFHYRPDDDDELVAEAVAAANREALDLILMPGDFVASSPTVIPPLLEHLSLLQARHGIFASMGNHDGWHDSRKSLPKQFEKAGIALPVNHHSLISVRHETLAVAATDFIWLGRPDPAKTLRGIHDDTPVISLVHEPDYFDTMLRHRRIDLQVSGHTHGGQCRIPGIPYTPVKVRHGEKYIHGSFESGDSRLFVTRGVGTTGIRVRFACAPELAILTLRSNPKPTF